MDPLPAVELEPIPPFPSLAARATGQYNSMAYAFGVHMGGTDEENPGEFVTQINALAENVQHNAETAAEKALAAVGILEATELVRDEAVQAKDDAETAVLSIETLNAQYLGAFATNPTTGKEGAPLFAGNFYINTGTGALLAYDGDSWVQAVASSGGVGTINGLSGTVELPKVLSYANRGDLRANETWVHALVDGLGWFKWVTGSDEPDDDESCFATASGRWLLQAPHWDVVSLWALPNDSTRDRLLEDQTTAWPGRVLKGTAVCGITSVNTVSSTAFNVAVIGAAVGDRVVATPPGALGATDADSGRLSYHAYVSAADVVTVRLGNASAATANVSTAAQGIWSVIVIKEV